MLTWIPVATRWRAVAIRFSVDGEADIAPSTLRLNVTDAD
jgi:hypothetical protein